MATLALRDRSVKCDLSNPAQDYACTHHILYNVGGKVRLAVRTKLNGRGHDEAEVDELVNDCFIQLLEALPRFDPATAG